MPRGISITERGLKTTLRFLNTVDKRIKGSARKEMLQEIGTKTKSYAQQEIQKYAFASGSLMKSMHYRVENDKVTIWNDAGIYAHSWEYGMKPHFIHRSMISEGGYKVGDWMDARGFRKTRNYLLVGYGKLGTGIHYMDIASDKIQKELPSIFTKFINEVIK